MITLDCPKCMHESGEGSPDSNCHECYGTGAVTYMRWKRLVFGPPLVHSIDAEHGRTTPAVRR